MGFIILLVILILTFLLRALPGILRIIGGSSGDQGYHILCAERIRENKFKYPDRLKGFLLPGIYDYPPLFHYFLALFSRTKREQLTPFFSAIIDTIHVLVIYTFILYIAQTPELTIYIPNPTLTACIAGLLFATSPSLIYYGLGPRAFHATPRTLGELFFTVSFLSGCIYYLQGGIWALFLAGIFAGLVFLTSKFGSQALIFFSIILALFLQSLFFIALPVFGLIAALVLSKGHYRKVFVGWIKHSILYKNIAQQKNVYTKFRNDPSQFKNIVLGIKEKDFREFSRSFLNIITNNTYVIFAIRNIMFFWVFYLVLKHLEIVTSNNVLFFLFSWIIASLIIFFMTSLRPFLFLGEAERYIEHSVPAQVILLSVLFAFWMDYMVFGLLLLYHLVFYVCNNVLIYGSYKLGMENRKAKEDLFSWFISNKIKGKKVLSIPIDYYEIQYKTDNAVLFPPANFTLIGEDEYEDLFEEYPYPNRDLEKQIKRYELELIVVNKRSLDYASKRGWNYDLGRFTKIFENIVYAVYECNSSLKEKTDNVH
jgi:hypothetical protein